jgi:hypothetical protein
MKKIISAILTAALVITLVPDTPYLAKADEGPTVHVHVVEATHPNNLIAGQSYVPCLMVPYSQMISMPSATNTGVSITRFYSSNSGILNGSAYTRGQGRNLNICADIDAFQVGSASFTIEFDGHWTESGDSFETHHKFTFHFTVVEGAIDEEPPPDNEKPLELRIEIVQEMANIEFDDGYALEMLYLMNELAGNKNNGNVDWYLSTQYKGAMESIGYSISKISQTDLVKAASKFGNVVSLIMIAADLPKTLEILGKMGTLTLDELASPNMPWNKHQSTQRPRPLPCTVTITITNPNSYNVNGFVLNSMLPLTDATNMDNRHRLVSRSSTQVLYTYTSNETIGAGQSTTHIFKISPRAFSDAEKLSNTPGLIFYDEMEYTIELRAQANYTRVTEDGSKEIQSNYLPKTVTIHAMGSGVKKWPANSGSYSALAIKCPVELQIFDSGGGFLGAIRNNSTDVFSAEGIFAHAEGEIKRVTILADYYDKYHIQVLAIDNGEMDVYAFNYSERTDEVDQDYELDMEDMAFFAEIPIIMGQEFAFELRKGEPVRIYDNTLGNRGGDIQPTLTQSDVVQLMDELIEALDNGTIQIQSPTGTEPASPDVSNPAGDTTWIWIVLIILAVCGGAGGAAVIIKKRNKNQGE